MPTLEDQPVIRSRAQVAADRLGTSIRAVITGSESDGWVRVRLYLLFVVVVVAVASAPEPVNYIGLIALFGIMLDLIRRLR